MGLFTPAWKSEKEGKALRVIEKIDRPEKAGEGRKKSKD
jgi:hypothetical protein